MLFTSSRDDLSETTSAILAVEIGTDLLNWPVVFHIGSDATKSNLGVTIEENGAAADIITVTIPVENHAANFARLTVTINL